MGLEKTSLMVDDNISVILNTTIPSSKLKKKHNVIAYHRAKEAIPSTVIHFCHLPSAASIADILTKLLSSEIFIGCLDSTYTENLGYMEKPRTLLHL